MDETLRKKSKREFTDPTNDISVINTGCLQRMADSLERMEKPYLKLISDIEYLQKRVRYLSDENERLTRSRNAYKGVITKLRKEASNEN